MSNSMMKEVFLDINIFYRIIVSHLKLKSLESGSMQ